MAAPPVSLLFVPGHRQRMVAKAAGLEAGAIVFDLEDSVPEGAKETARELIIAALAEWPPTASTPYVRANAPRSPEFLADLEVLAANPAAGIVIPKVDDVSELDPLSSSPSIAGRSVIVSIETPLSLLRVEAFAKVDIVDGLFLGGEDLTQALGMRRSETGLELDHARFQILTAARAYATAAYDTICPEFRDLDVLRVDAERAEAMGFDGKFAIHPAQLPTIHEAFQLSPAELAYLQRVVSAYDAAVQAGHGAVAVDGQMVDPPVAERARAKLRRGAAG